MEPAALTPAELYADTAWLNRVARTLVADSHAAEDLVQDAWLARVRRKEVREARAWWRRVLPHRLANLRRGEGRRAAREHDVASRRPEALPSTAELCERAELQRLLGREVLALDEPFRTTVLLHFLEGLTPDEIARRQDVPANTVRWRVRRGTARLRERLERELGREGRDWCLALLPLAAPLARARRAGVLPATAANGFHVLGGLLMLKKAWIVCAVALALSLGGWRLARLAMQPTTSSTASSSLAAPLGAITEAPSTDDRTPLTSRIAAAPAAGERGAVSTHTATIVFVAVARETGAPLAGVAAMPEAEGQDLVAHETARTRLTDTLGELRYEVPAGIPIHVQAWGEDPPAGLAIADVTPLAAGEVRRVRLEHPTTVDLRYFGHLTDVDGAPVAGGRIRTPSPSDIPGAVEEAVSDNEGRFELLVPSWRTTWFEAQAAGFGPIAFLPRAGFSELADARRLVLPRAATLEGRVEIRGAAGGGEARLVVAPHGGDIVRPPEDPERYNDHPGWSVAVDAAGRYSLPDLPSGTRLTVRVEVGGEVVLEHASDVVLQPDEVHRLDFGLEPGATLRGRLIDQRGEGVAEAELWLVRVKRASERRLYDHDRRAVVARVLTAGDGSFVFEEVPAGSWLVGPGLGDAATPSDLAPLARPVTIEAGLTPGPLRLETWRGLSLRGVVLRPDGSAASSVDVGLSAAGSTVLNVRSDAGGRFVARGLEPIEYVLSAGGLGEGHAAAEAIRAIPVDPTASGGEGTDIVLRLRPGGAVRGRVYDGEAPLTRGMLLVSARGAHQAAGGWMHIGVRVTGYFQLDGLAPGPYDVFLGRDDGWCVLHRLDVEAGPPAEDLELHLEPGGRLTLTLAADLPWLAVDLFHDGAFLDFGALRGEGDAMTATVPAGTTEVRTKDPTGRVESVFVDVPPGETTELLLSGE